MSTNNDTFIPAGNVRQLSKHCATTFDAAARLYQQMTDEIDDPTRARLFGVLDGGGRVGIECLVDARGAPSVALVGIELEGRRHVFAEVQIVGNAPTSRTGNH